MPPCRSTGQPRRRRPCRSIPVTCRRQRCRRRRRRRVGRGNGGLLRDGVPPSVDQPGRVSHGGSQSSIYGWAGLLVCRPAPGLRRLHSSAGSGSRPGRSAVATVRGVSSGRWGAGARADAGRRAAADSAGWSTTCGGEAAGLTMPVTVGLARRGACITKPKPGAGRTVAPDTFWFHQKAPAMQPPTRGWGGMWAAYGLRAMAVCIATARPVMPG
jgi:hypothetical protein